ncbi:MAG: DNA-directed RNA polymerase subunit omega [Spirochaetaceae bacterium]|nr:DNA-directed RNA polymerase subunit omega [Spirochaetaceae bacterium]
MIMPLEQLIEYDTNSYELTVAVTHRAYQLAVIKGPEVEKYNSKVVSLATRQIFTKQVEYKLLD